MKKIALALVSLLLLSVAVRAAEIERMSDARPTDFLA